MHCPSYKDSLVIYYFRLLLTCLRSCHTAWAHNALLLYADVAALLKLTYRSSARALMRNVDACPVVDYRPYKHWLAATGMHVQRAASRGCSGGLRYSVLWLRYATGGRHNSHCARRVRLWSLAHLLASFTRTFCGSNLQLSTLSHGYPYARFTVRRAVSLEN